MTRRRIKRREVKPLPACALHELVRVTGSALHGYGVDVSGFLGTEELQTPNRALALRLCRAVRAHCRSLTPEAQRRAFNPAALAAVEGNAR